LEGKLFVSATTVMHCMDSHFLYINSLGPITDISVMRLSASWCHFRQCPRDLVLREHAGLEFIQASYTADTYGRAARAHW